MARHGGSVENRNARQTVWTMPDGPGLHFAYVTVSDGRGGHVEQQYAVATDAFGATPAARPPVTRAAPAVTTTASSAGRLRFSSSGDPNSGGLKFTDGSGAAVERTVYLPDVQVQIEPQSGGSPVFSGATDLGGELTCPISNPAPTR